MYCNFINKTIEEFMDEAETEEEDGVRLRRRKVAKYLRDFNKHVKDLGYSEKTIEQAMLAVKAYYKHYDIVLPIPKNKLSRKAKVRNAKYTDSMESIPTIDEIRRFLTLCNDLYKLIVLFGISSGMGQAEIGSLTFKHLYEACELHHYPKTMEELIEKLESKGNFIPTWHIRRVKTGMKYFTFTSPELMKYMLVYFKEYHRKYPDYKPKPEDQLLKSLKYNGRPLNQNNFAKYFSELGKVHDLRKHNSRFVCTAHGFRRFFATTLEQHKMPHLTIRRLMGHKFDEVTKAYFKIDVETAKEDYLDAVNELSVDTIEVKTIESSEYKELKEQYEKDSKAKDEEISRMNRELELIKQILGDKATRKELDKRDSSI